MFCKYFWFFKTSNFKKKRKLQKSFKDPNPCTFHCYNRNTLLLWLITSKSKNVFYSVVTCYKDMKWTNITVNLHRYFHLLTCWRSNLLRIKYFLNTEYNNSITTLFSWDIYHKLTFNRLFKMNQFNEPVWNFNRL